MDERGQSVHTMVAVDEGGHPNLEREHILL